MTAPAAPPSSRAKTTREFVSAPIRDNPESVSDVVKRVLHVRRARCLQCSAEFTRFVGHHRCDDCTQRYLDGVRRRRSGPAFEDSSPQKEHREAYALAKAWRPLTSNVYLQGDIGCGKTFLGRCMLRRAKEFDPRRVTNWLTALEFTEIFRGPSYAPRATGVLYSSHVLLIDDLDKAPWGGTALHWLWQILDERRRKQFSTIVTTNMDEGSLCNFFTEHTKNASLPRAIMDRLRPVLNIRMAGNSLREAEESLQEAAGQEELF